MVGQFWDNRTITAQGWNFWNNQTILRSVLSLSLSPSTNWEPRFEDVEHLFQLPASVTRERSSFLVASIGRSSLSLSLRKDKGLWGVLVMCSPDKIRKGGGGCLKLKPLLGDIHIQGEFYPGLKVQTNNGYGSPGYLYPGHSNIPLLYTAAKQAVRVSVRVTKSQKCDRRSLNQKDKIQ